MIGELTDTATKRITEYKRRKKPFIEHSFLLDERDQALTEGWELVKENKSSIRFRKQRKIDEILENEFWRLLYEFGYRNLGVGRKFQIELRDRKNFNGYKHVDVFAFDDETIVIAECRACNKRSKQDLGGSIEDLASFQKKIASTLNLFFGGKIEQKILWMLVTRNIDWTKADRTRAADNNIRIITEKELLYYREVAKRVGHAARYQFHAEFLAKSKVPALQSIEVAAIRTKLGGNRVYSFFAPAKKLLPISFVNHRDLRDPDAAPSYQRLIQRARLKSISTFIEKGGFFPNSIILNFKQKASFNPFRAEDEDGVTSGILTLPSTYKSAWIIDGQHRLYGYTENLDGQKPTSLLPFLAFERISIPEETKIFSDINSKQKRVEKKLLDEITGEIKLKSSDKREQMRAIASRVFDIMRDDDDGPLGGKIAGAEIAHTEGSILTIPYLVDATIQANLLGRLTNKEGKEIFAPGPLSWLDPRDGIDNLVEFFTEYLKLFQAANFDRWEAGRSGKISTNPGVAAIIRLSADVITFLAEREELDPRTLHPKVLVEKLETYLAPCLAYLRNASDEETQQRFHVPFGSGGPRIFQHRLRELLAKDFPLFDALGFKEDLRKYDAARTEKTDKMIRLIQDQVHGYIIKKLKSAHNNSPDYLELAVDNREVLKKAYDKRLDSDDSDRKDMGTYFDFLDLRKIIEAPKNWPLFLDTMNISMPDEKRGKARYVKWFDEVNKARRIPAHPYNRGYSDEDVFSTEFIFKRLVANGVIVE